MTKEELQKEIVEDEKRNGHVWYAKYIEMFGYEEPLFCPCSFESNWKKLEEIAKECVEKGKTATELGLYPRESNKDDDLLI